MNEYLRELESELRELREIGAENWTEDQRDRRNFLLGAIEDEEEMIRRYNERMREIMHDDPTGQDLDSFLGDY